MFSDFNVKAILIMLLFTCAAIGAHEYGLLDTSFDIRAENPDMLKTPIIEGSAVKSEFIATEQSTRLNCSITDKSSFSMCGISLLIGLHDEASDTIDPLSFFKGKDFSKYDKVELAVEYSSPIPDQRMRFTLRNYDQKYSIPNDFVSLKFNSVLFTPKSNVQSQTIPFTSFRVEDWWIKERNIGFEDAQVDISNIVFIEIITDKIDANGDHSIVVRDVIFRGQMISDLTLFQVILVCWLIFIIALVLRQTAHLKHISNTDALTKLMNRRGISDWTNRASATFVSKQKGVLFYFDIDGFKKVNDTHGHALGDDLLCALGKIVGEILKEYEDSNNIAFSRLAGDEFVIVANRIDKQQADTIAASILKKLSSPININNRLLKVGVSMGLSSFDPIIDTFDEALSRADSAMYCAKRDGKNRYRFFDDHVRDVIYRRKQIAESIRKAAENNEFSMAYMPIFKAKNLYIQKVEVLLRCHAPGLDGVGPDEFIPIAEEFGVIQNIDLLVIETTFRHMYRHQKVFRNSNIKVCINISAKELNNVHFVSSLKALLTDYRIDPQQIELEITETSLVEIDSQSISILNDIRNTGISLALDDFGTGYTAFSQIIEYPIDCLKIDKSFIDDLHPDNTVKRTMISSILAIAKSYNLETVAEGIEKDEQFKLLKEMGCDCIQGYLLSKPISWAHFKTLLEDQDGKGNLIKVVP
ncbi:bifunctional diguanylate cyclase/phosphodiesterase [Glaciecola sp. MH2013]|uniref:putative bifunctional diguanylate cyclase/phosphodiesterase n=1 Tax=Glaciecola sp. MH2013 TaxID=2785524 RepID=UPI00189D13FE|nr:bifunctional diguanylate cyclase/phosphodiesterase [Glaciecola sp. MH2013]MBF7072815.1 bifunctional diguanylate cyclase/phosphodiesterase [Glaciecola sp. MH2013]